MPLAVGTLVVPDVETDVPVYVPRPADIPSAAYVDPLGRRILLTDLSPGRRQTPWFTPAPGPTGLGVTPRTVVTDRRDRGGVSVRTVRRDERIITWPIFVQGANHAEFVARWRELGNAFSMTADYGPGIIEFTRPDGSTRVIDAWYQSGFDGEPDMGITYDLAVVTLLCPRGNWRSPVRIPITRRAASAGRSFLTRFPRVSSSQTLGNTTVTNPGDVPAWPRWTITGPASSLVATNVTRGETWTLNIAAYRGSNLAAGEQITIDTETGEVAGPAGGPAGTDWAGALDWTTSTLWQLDRGNSTISFTLTGDGAASTIAAVFDAEFNQA